MLGNQPKQLVGAWKCRIAISKSNDELTVDTEFNWTEKLQLDGRYNMHGILKADSGNIAAKTHTIAKFQIVGEGYWSATDKTFTSGFHKLNVKSLSKNWLVELLNVDKLKNNFKKTATETYSIIDRHFIRYRENEAVHAECTPST